MEYLRSAGFSLTRLASVEVFRLANHSQVRLGRIKAGKEVAWDILSASHSMKPKRTAKTSYTASTRSSATTVHGVMKWPKTAPSDTMAATSTRLCSQMRGRKNQAAPIAAEMASVSHSGK